MRPGGLLNKPEYLVQSHLQSAVETAVNYIVGYALAWLIMKYLLRWLGFPINNSQTSGVVMIFTIVSILRSYAIRRFFNWLNARAIMKSTLIHPLDKRV